MIVLTERAKQYCWKMWGGGSQGPPAPRYRGPWKDALCIPQNQFNSILAYQMDLPVAYPGVSLGTPVLEVGAKRERRNIAGGLGEL